MRKANANVSGSVMNSRVRKALQLCKGRNEKREWHAEKAAERDYWRSPACKPFVAKDKHAAELAAMMTVGHVTNYAATMKAKARSRHDVARAHLKQLLKFGMPIKGGKGRKATRAELAMAREAVVNRMMVMGDGDLSATLLPPARRAVYARR